MIRYEPTRPDDGALRQRLRELAAERRRFGYRRLGYLLAREGIAPNHKKLLRWTAVNESSLLGVKNLLPDLCPLNAKPKHSKDPNLSLENHVMAQARA